MFESVTSEINISSAVCGVTELNPLTSTIRVEVKAPEEAVDPPDKPDPVAVVMVTAVMSAPPNRGTQST